MVAPGPDLPEPRSGGDAHVARCSRLFDVHDPCGTHSIWYRLLSLGLTSFGMAILGIFHVALRVRPMTLRPSGGELPRCILLLQLRQRRS